MAKGLPFSDARLSGFEVLRVGESGTLPPTTPESLRNLPL